ncbi:hypothetical protein B0H11DRAFT_1346836 [Mycena galericulata]|nr:hypothetical protein B0H11DRAFT_1346836 [Mycena galericulata]
MFHGAHTFNALGAEFNNVGGSVHRYDSPTVLTVHNVPHGPPSTNNDHSGYPSATQHPANTPHGYAPPPPATYVPNGHGMFAGASNFSLVGAEVNNVPGNMVRQRSGTTMTVNYASAPVNNQGQYHTSGSYDNARGGTYNDHASSTSGNYHGRDYDHHRSAPNAPANRHGHSMGPGDRRASGRLGGVSRRNSESPYPSNTTTVENRGSRQPPRARTHKTQEYKKKKYNGNNRRAEPTVEEDSADEAVDHPRVITRTQTF